MSHIDASKETYNTFLRCAHVNFRIIACLRAEKALDMFQVSQLSGEKSLIKRSEMIFEWMEKSQSLYDIFLRVMVENEQQHVSNLLKGIKDGPHIPLSLLRYTRLEKITPKLMDVIRNDTELVANLRAKHAISKIDRQDITQEKKEYKRNWNLIEAILRRSEYAFDCFDQALRETLQVHAAHYLHEGHLVAVHANTTNPDKDEVIADLFNKTILYKSKDDTSSEEKIFTSINGYNIQPVAAKPGQSIVLFLYCKTIDDMTTFTELFNSGDLQSIVEVIFNRLLSTASPENTEQLKARLSLDNTEILAVEKFSGIEDWMSVELEKAILESKIFQSTATQTKELQTEGTDPCPLASGKNSEEPGHGSYVDISQDIERKSHKIKEIVRKIFTRKKNVKTADRSRNMPSGKKSEESGHGSYVDLSQDIERRSHKIKETIRSRDLEPVYGCYANVVRSLPDFAYDYSHFVPSQGATDNILPSASTNRFSQDKLRIEYKMQQVLVHTIRARAEEEEMKAIVGLTILDKELFVVYQKSSNVDVYDSEKFSFCRRLNLEELFSPKDLGSCNRNKCLYIFDYKGIGESSEILRVDPNGKLIKNWSTGNDWGWGLSVTDETNVILAVSNKNKLNEYSPDGQLIREISLSSEAGIRFPRHAVQLSSGHFVVSHCDFGADLHRVCIVDADGKPKESFGGKCGSTLEQLNAPVHLTIDQDENVTIVDRGNSRVLLLDSRLEFKREILSKEKHGLRDPMRILLDQANGKLFVGDNGEGYGRILVFDFELITKF